MAGNVHKMNIVRNLAYPAIDGVRFYAAFVVFIEHTVGIAASSYFGIKGQDLSYHSDNVHLRILFYIADGNHGVDVFFIISGFLMTRIVLSNRNHFNYPKFIKQRFLRIYPAFFISLTVTTACDVLMFGWPWKPFEFTKNLVFANAIPFWGVLSYNNVSWSLGYEIAFYLIVPVLVLMTRLLKPSTATILLLISSIILLQGPFIRMQGLFVGGVIGSFRDDQLSRLARATPLWITAMLYVGCAVLKACWFATFNSYYYSFLVVASFMFIKVVWDERNILSCLFKTRALRTLGTLSFSIYLYHSLVAAFVQTHLTPYPPSHWGAVRYEASTVLITLLVAYASYMFVERPYFSRKPSSEGTPRNPI